MRQKSIALFALFALALVGACGGEGGDAANDAAANDSADSGGAAVLTKDEFIERGDAVCAELEVASGQVEVAESQEDFGRYLKELREPAQMAREDWNDLNPPADGEGLHQSMSEQFDTVIKSLDGAATAAESGDTVTAEDLRAQAEQGANAMDPELQAYGFQECGKTEPLPEEPDPAPIDEPAEG